MACQLLGIRMSRVYDLMRRGELCSYSCGRARRITTQSIEDYVARRVADSAAMGWRAWSHNPRARSMRRRDRTDQRELHE
jgi:excisionase family DNA binding protein